MSLLTMEQRLIFDETVRLRALNGGEEGLSVPEAHEEGYGKHHDKLPGNRVKKGENRIKTDLLDSAKPVYVLDQGDPNYDSGEEPYKLRAARGTALPRTDVIVAYKSLVTKMSEEYFLSNDIDEVGLILDQTEQPLYQHYFVKRLVTLAMDRGNREKEAAAVLLSRLYPSHLDVEQIQRGFERLLESVDDLALDVPSASSDLAMFIARAVVDDILPPKFIDVTLEGLLPGLRQAEKAAETIDLAHGHLSDRHCTERVLRAWGDPEKSPIDAAKAAIQDLLSEYLVNGDVSEARTCLHALNARYFHHELVKRALVLCIEAAPGNETAPRLLGLLKVLADSGEVAAGQMEVGFSRMTDVVVDLKLDVPNAEERLDGLKLMAKEEGIYPPKE
ncbi:hypothetical protein N9L76_01265 [bacterium]|nr:hypothetical protein [bacterium]